MDFITPPTEALLEHLLLDVLCFTPHGEEVNVLLLNYTQLCTDRLNVFLLLVCPKPLKAMFLFNRPGS